MSTVERSLDLATSGQSESQAGQCETPMIQLSGVSKSYRAGAGKNLVLENINISVATGEFLAICGFSGSGKTTLAQIISGLIAVDCGQVQIAGRRVKGPSPECGIVFQNYSLLPWLTVRGNIALSVDCVFSSWSKADRSNHIDQFIELVGLKHAAQRYPRELSGGMRQRTSLARTLAMKPQVLVLDEPLSALDALTRSTLQAEILKIWEEERQTCVMITNDVDEALLMADRIVPLNPGPGATFGPEFSVTLDRPRDKTRINQDPNFKLLRNQITGYLLKVRDEVRTLQNEAAEDGSRTLNLPNLEPIHDREEKVRV
jgi:nitrate/nitrite transport system ATP-binding protein